MNNSLVSIIITYYNKKNTICRAVDSVINQSYENWELIIIDDKSVEPLEISEKWSKYNIRYIHNQHNLGAAQSRQKGQEAAQGEFIAFLDADDWWGDFFLKHCLDSLTKDEDNAGAYVKIIEFENSQYRRRNLYSGLTDILDTVICYRRPWQTSGILWRKRIIGNWGELTTSEDSWFEITTAKCNNKLIYIDSESCFNNRDGDNHLSKWSGQGKSALNQQELYMMIFKQFWLKINLKQKIVLFNRLIRGQLKIHEYSKEDAMEMGLKLKKLNPFLFWMFKSPFMLKSIHIILQRSRFKITF